MNSVLRDLSTLNQIERHLRSLLDHNRKIRNPHHVLIILVHILTLGPARYDEPESESAHNP